MKGNIPSAAIAGIVAVVVIVLGVVFVKKASGESTAPKPDPARFRPTK